MKETTIIRNLMTTTGTSQNKMADTIGKSQSAVSAYLRTEYLSVQTFEMLLTALDYELVAMPKGSSKPSGSFTISREDVD